MTVSASSADPIEVALFFETTQGTPPANAAAWIAGEGTTVVRLGKVEGIDPAFIKRMAVVDPAITDTVFGENDPIPGLFTSDGGSLKLRLHGTGVETTAASQVAETMLGKILSHAFGGSYRTYSSDITSSASAVEINPTTVTNMNEGAFVALEDEDDPGRCFPGRIVAFDGTTIDIDQDHGITWTSSDHIHGCEVAYLEADAMSDPGDADASTVSIYIRRGNKAWMASGCKLAITAIEIVRGEPVRLDVAVFGARGFPPGDASNPGVIAFTGTIYGAPGLPVGADTKMFVQDKGTTTQALFDVQSIKITPGYTIIPGDTVTETDDNMQGRAGYHVQPTPAVIEATVYWNDTRRTEFAAVTKKVVRYYQVAAPGEGWFVHASQAVLQEDPGYSPVNNSNMQVLKFLLQEDRSLDGLGPNDHLTRSKIHVGRF
jgi:hypothetical protein